MDVNFFSLKFKFKVNSYKNYIFVIRGKGSFHSNTNNWFYLDDNFNLFQTRRGQDFISFIQIFNPDEIVSTPGFKHS